MTQHIYIRWSSVERVPLGFVMFVALLIVTLSVLAAAVYSVFKKNNHPPGPRGLPLIGQALSIDWGHQDRSFTEWSRRYGPILKVTAGWETMIVLSDPDLIREAFNGPMAAARQSSAGFELMYADKGIIFTSGEMWHETRRFTLFHLRNFGMGRSRSVEIIHDQIKEFMEEVMEPNNGQPTSVDHSLNVAILNIIWALVAGEIVSIRDAKLLKIIEKQEEFTSKARLFFLLANIPCLMLLPEWITGINKIRAIFHYPIDHLLLPAIESHRRTVDLTGEARDYIDCLLQEQSRQPELFTDRHLLRCILDLFVAGFDTTASTLRWAFCFLCTHQEVQQRLHDEICRVIGRERAPELADKASMPYTEAFLMETQRLSNIAGIGVAHVSTAEFRLGGYTVPRGAQVISNLTAVHLDGRLFPEPHRFRPERFLDERGQLRPSRALMPFSVGRRSCLGETLARTELFLFVTSVVQRYRLRFPDGFQHDFAINESKPFIKEPTPYQLIPERR
ncbi:Cytochrome P450 2J6 [Amphibalanus amphitrite]|uniref:Cytochrome P450 2J6 n=2 Tax=Amphibalanus amphitrite TaxID=1232801 RepID=A0A6A4W5Q4_AMPAM|nr:Cytochrome P450 2J6 [Amphibalanus amphitrite]